MEKQKCPEIRFNQFNENWSIISLGDLMNVGSVKRVHQADWCDTGVRFLRARDIVAFAKNEDIADPIYISQDRYEEYSKLSGKVKVGDLLVTGVGTIGVPMLVGNDDPLYFKDGNVIWFKNENAINGLFLYYSFINKTIQNFIKDSAGIGTVGTYTITSGKRTPIYLPKENEQSQIGKFFQNLDQSIALHEKKLSQTQNLKKAMLEKMFPKAGCKQPEIRLKGFSGDWEKKLLDDEVEFFSGLTYSPDDVINKNGTLVLRSSNVQGNQICTDDNVYVVHDAVNVCNVEVGDIIVVVRNGSRSLIGKHAVINKQMKNTVIGAFMTGVKAKNPYFINALFDTSLFDVAVSRNLGATINQITTGMFKQMEFKFPNKTEQIAIGKFFKQLDETLVLQQQQLQTLKNLKRAFLEKMFV